MLFTWGREIGIGVAVIVSLWIAVRVVRSARRLNAGVREAKEAQEKQDGVVDPYAAMAELYAPPKKEQGKWD